jgi:hypothetical protein
MTKNSKNFSFGYREAVVLAAIGVLIGLAIVITSA